MGLINDIPGANEARFCRREVRKGFGFGANFVPSNFVRAGGSSGRAVSGKARLFRKPRGRAADQRRSVVCTGRMNEAGLEPASSKADLF